MKTTTGLALVLLFAAACSGAESAAGGGEPEAEDRAAPGTSTRRIATDPAQPAPGSNPIIRDVWTADPAALVHDGTVYLYAGHDRAREGEEFNIPEWLAFSSTDMRNWRAHGPIMKPTDFEWAIGRAWASEVEEKDGRFWFYTTVEHDEDVGFAIGVAKADDPLGPFEDARGSALITNDMTPQKSHAWSDIDPTVFTDDDGTSWLAWGNEQYFFARLADSMTELDGEIRTQVLPHFTEGPWIHKHEDTYYLTYAGIDRSVSDDEQIHYATASSVEGPWDYQGMLTGSAENSFTIHPATIELNGQWYFLYHDGSLTIDGQQGANGRRAVRVEYLYHTDDNRLVPVEQTLEGVSRPPDPPRR